MHTPPYQLKLINYLDMRMRRLQILNPRRRDGCCSKKEKVFLTLGRTNIERFLCGFVKKGTLSSREQVLNLQCMSLEVQFICENGL